MTKKYIQIAELIYKDKIGMVTEEEKRELYSWLEESEFNRQVFEELSKGSTLSRSYEEYRSVHRKQVWEQLEQQIAPRQRSLSWQWMGYAASVIVLLVAGWFVYTLVRRENQAVKELTQKVQIVPGAAKAVLYLESGEQVFLADKDVVIDLDSIGGKISKVNNALVYQLDSSIKEIRQNVLEVPRGGEFQVVLADGTKVWLNAGSRLTYPTAFVGKERKVSLVGEGYFEVQRDERKPFVVDVNGMEVTVLGTSFNMKSFVQDGRTTATLINGKIRVKTSSRDVVLTPNQQADLLVGENHLDVREVDAEAYRAWISGKFVFRRERLESILDDVARWYNVTVFYEQGSVKDILFSGIVERYADITETLEMLEKTNKVVFVIDKDKIIVKAK